MSALVEAIEAKVGSEALATECRKENTTVLLDGAPTPHAVVDLDSSTLGLSERRRCDYLFVADALEAGWVAVIELKSRTFSAEGVIEQLEGGAELADEWLPEEVPVNFRPVLVHRLRTFGMHRNTELDKWRVQFRGSRVKVQTLSSGARLMAALDPKPEENEVGHRRDQGPRQGRPVE